MICRTYGKKVANVTGSLELDVFFMLWRKFCDGEIRILIATDLISRCIASENVCLIVNFDIPNLMGNFKVYQYRAGRTGRFGGSESVLTLLYHFQNTFKSMIKTEYGIDLRNI